MKISRFNYEDVRRYYKNTYVKFKETGDHVWFIREVDPEKLVAVDDKGEEVAIDLYKEYEIEYIIPGKTAFQFGDRAYALRRIPLRQFYRGMHPENTEFVELAADGKWRKQNLSFDIVQGFVNKPVYWQIQDVIPAALKGEGLSWALSPQIAVSVNGEVMTVSGTSIGRVGFLNKMMACNKLFVPELERLGLFNSFELIKAPKKRAPAKKKEAEVEVVIKQQQEVQVQW